MMSTSTHPSDGTQFPLSWAPRSNVSLVLKQQEAAQEYQGLSISAPEGDGHGYCSCTGPQFGCERCNGYDSYC